MPNTMKPLALGGLVALALAACAPAAPVTPAPAPAPPPAQPPAPVLAVGVRQAPENWHLLDASDTLLGTGVLRAERELLAGRQPRRTVVVAIIDSGVDTTHADLAANLWRNPREQPNGRDDDGNGYADDVRGWNFIGGPDGRDVQWDTFEVTRLFARCSQAAAVAALPAAERERCPAIREAYDRRRSEAEQTLQQIIGITQMLTQASAVLQRAVGTESLTVARVRALESTRSDVRQARELYLRLAADELTTETLADYRETYENQLRYGFNTSYDPRPIVQDDTTNPRERRYGNPGVMGPDPEHGTHVAGIVGAVRGNGAGIDGIAPAVQLMVLRTVPDGDERDKDVANAIRYAADNGAHIINMSFGKAYSPHKAVVDAAVRHADSLGVLMIHAAGNDGDDLAEHENFPMPVLADSSRARNWLTVGASSWKQGDSLVAAFSNYGQAEVDLFAPGVDIYSTVPEGGYERNSGTSMAAPVVTGIAALLMAHYPTLTAADVKRILLESATRRPDRPVIRPGTTTGERVPFGTLSATGGVVNAYEAVRLAEQMTGGRQP